MTLRTAFFLVSALSTLCIPSLVAMCGSRIGCDWLAGLVAGGVAIGAIMHEGGRSMLGITLDATFNFGLYSQPLACDFLLLAFFFGLHAHRSRLSAAGAALALGLVPLSNVHVVWNAATLMVPLVLLRVWEHRRSRTWVGVCATFAAVAASAMLLCMPWVLPMLARIDFVPTQAMPPVEPIQVVRAFLRVSVYLALAAAVAYWRRNHDLLALVAGLALGTAASLLPAEGPLKNVALQPWRLLAVFEPLAAIGVGYLVAQARLLTTRGYQVIALAVAVVALFFWRSRPLVRASALVGDKQYADYQNALRPLSGRLDGRVLVEMGEGNEGFSMQALSGLQGNPTLTTVFRESALTSLFAVPLRNTFSSKSEEYGIDSKARYWRLQREVPAITDLDRRRLRLFDVHYFAATSPQLKQLLRDDAPEAQLLSEPGRWEAYSWNGGGAYAEVPRYAPVLTFAPFSVKKRPDVGFDFVRLGEEMFIGGWLDVPLALAPSPMLDADAPWGDFSSVLVTDYAYRDADRAFAALEAVSRTGDLFLLEAPGEPLFERLRSMGAGRSSIHVIEREPADALDRAGAVVRAAHPELGEGDVAARAAMAVVQVTCARLFRALDEHKRSVEGAPGVSSTEIERGEVRVVLSETPRGRVPVWIKQSFFPGWVADDGARPLMATPTFQLVFADRREVTLRYRPDRFVLAKLLGVAGLAGAVALAMSGRRRARRSE
jgi:hypothetical protein